MVNASRGFTMVELVMVIVIIGILAAVAIPRMNTSGYRAAEFHDRVVAALRYAQKTATSHRRLVCVAFSASSVTLTIASTNSPPPSNCDTSLNLPGTTSNVAQSGDSVNAIFNSFPGNLNFKPDGTSTDASLSIAGQPAITVVGATGSVY